MNDQITVFINGEEKSYMDGTSYLAAAKEYQKEYAHDIVLATVDGKLKELNKRMGNGEHITFVTVADPMGFSAYRRSVLLLLLKAIRQVGGEEQADRVWVHFAVSEGVYITMRGQKSVTAKFLHEVKTAMKELAKRDIVISKEAVDTDKAIALFGRLGMEDKEKLFHYRMASKVNTYSLDGFCDYFYGYMVPGSGYLKYFELYPYDEGFVLQIPTIEEPEKVPPFAPEPKLFAIQKESLEWSELMEVTTAGDLNEQVISGKISDLILMQEALQEKKIAQIASQIAADPQKKLIMIAGPSSSGKTTFSHRLAIQLAVNGMKPHPIPMDNYFVDREKTPRDENGNYDFERVDALDIELFNQNMTDLLAGKEVELPEFDFRLGKRKYTGNRLQLGERDVLVIEGIHALNDQLSHSLPRENKFKIYISALTQLNIDEHNRIPTTDGRLLRRIIRDARTRGTSAKNTIAMWPSVRRGEEHYIFPNQEEADVMFNSALIYELAVLKTYAEPLLFGIERTAPEYVEAKRLLKFLDYFVAVPGESIPQNSLLREFIGGGCFGV
ncbi:phosphoribulokinase/uridine kinase family protein [Marvinbryantia formatexigens DSM 14469]|uniref:Phosphoribulokinase/uridine kinase family protein n=1 Tax=Marvinbryantia formatexigens DSM 14469 TaxID=478749 RepID=C6LLI3_9FIRM|nr:nucleoside kinase [Marvinbryantia formatexigens]EET58523.1 phosphoribulokinase/uridine kinase family protein [Marvinbryantia formatexigens DSM 14469]UWO24907.1 nucleoside kinase [Marvinbryantia formatexigens DSM 14469]SDH15499.1 uridine kinase [Marvinbryantia formatexigens]